MMDFAATWKHLFFFLQIHVEIFRKKKSLKRRREMTRSQNLLTSHYAIMECERIRRAVDTPFFFLSSVDFSMSSLMQATRLFFSFVDIRRERRKIKFNVRRSL